MNDVGERSRATRRQVLQATGGALAVGTLSGRGAAQASGPTVYVGSGSGFDDGTLYAVDAATGEQEWAFTRPNRGVSSSPTVVDGTVYVGSDDETLYAVEAATGSQQWAFAEPSNQLKSSPTVVNGTVYLGSHDETLYAVDAETGAQQWTFTEPDGPINSSPTAYEGTVYVGSGGLLSDTGTLYAVDATTSEQEWAFTRPNSAVLSSPTVADGTVYVGSKDETLYAVDTATGEQEWAFTRPNRGVDSSPTVVDGTVYVGSDDGTLYAVEAATGTQQWAFEKPGDNVSSSPTVYEGTVYVGSWDNTLYALDAKTGSLEWKFIQPSDELRPSPTVYEGTVYVGSFDETLYAVDAATGDQQWAFTHPDFVLDSSPTVVADPQNGDSVGSRARLGTLGHHDNRADRVTTAAPAFFEVTVEDVTERPAGEQLEVTVTVANTGDRSDTQTISLSVDNIGSDSTTVSLDSGESTTETLSVQTGNGDAGEYTATVDAGDSQTTETVIISEPVQGDDGGLGTTEMAAVGGGASLALLFGVYALMRRSGEDDTETEHTQETSPEPDTQSPDSGETTAAAQQPSEDVADEVDALLEDAATELDRAAESLDHDSLHDAEKTLDNVTETLDTARESLNEQEFPELTDRLASLDRRHEQLQQQVDDERVRVPTTVPDAPRCSLSYSDVEMRDELGKGGNADLYRATATTDRGTVDIAVKEPRMGGETLDTETVEGMIDEAKTWQQLDDHDHITSVVDYGSNPLPWIAIEYMDGGHLGERAGNLPVEQALWTAVVTTKGVRHAHRHGVAHLDLKPENILFRSVANAWDVPKVADWGLSKHLLEHSKSVEELSPHYAAPEQFDDSYGSADDVTDIYQLGTVFYELFTGRPPFEGPPARVMNRVLTEEPAPPSEVAAVPRELDDVLMTALAKEKSERYESVLYLRDGLQELRESL
jgi:outer membrane protein assembly factor BamB/serine/threonine protein kinase